MGIYNQNRKPKKPNFGLENIGLEQCVKEYKAQFKIKDMVKYASQMDSDLKRKLRTVSKSCGVPEYAIIEMCLKPYLEEAIEKLIKDASEQDNTNRQVDRVKEKCLVVKRTNLKRKMREYKKQDKEIEGKQIERDNQ
jgi:hypothetical protein